MATVRSWMLAVLAVLVWAPGARAQAGQLRLDLNIPELKLVVYEGDQVLRSYPVAVGMPGHDTPSGSFTIDHAQWNPWWRPPQREWAQGEKVTPPGPNNPMGRVKLFFLPLYFIHGTPESQSIGTPASHGCVRMRNEDVVELARLLHERAAPQVSNADIDRILARHSNTRRVDFRGGIPLEVRYDPVVVGEGELRVYPDIYGRNAVHTEAVYQALLTAGYDVSEVRAEDVRRFVERARSSEQGLKLPLDEVFGSALAEHASHVAPGS